MNRGLIISTFTAAFWDKIPDDDRSRFNTVMSMLHHGGGGESGMMNVVNRPLEGNSTPQVFHSRFEKRVPVSQWVAQNCESAPNTASDVAAELIRQSTWATRTPRNIRPT
jgi:hypothetical protein